MSNHSTVSLDAKTAERILEEVEAITKSLDMLRKRIIKLFPPQYGSNAWWEKEIREGLEEVKHGKVKKFKSMEEAVHYLNS